MDAVLERLVRAEDRLLLLFTPPFDQTPHDPGYIKGYVPGTRENGGQYTHAAIWTTWAYLELGRAATAERLFRLLNPVLHADTAAAVDRYKVEPYVIAADVYSVAPHTGRGGWTWYTGSAAWMYRLGIEGILGLRRTAGGLHIDPCIPPDWPGFEATYRHGSATYHIQVRRDGSSAARPSPWTAGRLQATPFHCATTVRNTGWTSLARPSTHHATNERILARHSHSFLAPWRPPQRHSLTAAAPPIR